MPTKLLVIGLDGVEAPAFLDINASVPPMAPDRSVAARLLGHHSLLTDTVWPELQTGRDAHGTGIYYPPLQVRAGELRLRAVRPGETRPDRAYWSIAADAGLKAAVVDQPFAYRSDQVSFEISEWGTHDRTGWSRTAVKPAEIDLLTNAGDHPVASCDRRAGRDPDRLVEDLLEGVARKTRLLGELLDRSSWDLFTATYSEGHCAGHQFWGGREVDEIYAALGSAVASLADRAGGGASVVVFCSHGMSPADHGHRYISPLLQRMGVAPRAVSVRSRISRWLPPPVHSFTRRAIGGRWKRLDDAGRTVLGATSGSAMPVPNSRHGAIRFFLAGRDPGASLVPGSREHRSLIANITAACGELVEVATGAPAVEDVVEIDEALGPDRSPHLPDLIVRFRVGGLIAACVSPTYGTLRAPNRSSRTGEHGTPGAVWVSGPGLKGKELPDARTVDLAPTLLELLGLAQRPWMDGTSLDLSP